MAKRKTTVVAKEVDVTEIEHYRLRNYTEILTYDDNGDVTARKFFRGSSNGKGWSIMYNDKILELITKCTSGATLRVFMYLAAGQQFEERGMITTKVAVQQRLKITKQTCLEAFKWLKQNFIINEYRTEGGYTEFMVNPEYVTIGKDKKKRQKEWIRRWSGQTVLTLPSDGSSPLGAIAEPKPEKKPVKKKRGVISD